MIPALEMWVPRGAEDMFHNLKCVFGDQFWNLGDKSLHILKQRVIPAFMAYAFSVLILNSHEDEFIIKY